MKFKKQIVIRDFLQDVQKCKGDVCFQTNEGDILNLKSKLSEYIFLAAAVSTRDLLSGGEILLANLSDLELLAGHLQDS